MSGTDRTADLTQPLFGILVPYDARLPTSDTGIGRGVDWTEASPILGRAVPSGSSSAIAMEGAGTPDEATLDAVKVQVIRPGAPSVGGAGIAYKREVSGSLESRWYGADAPHILTGYQRINTRAAHHPDFVALGDGTAVLAYPRGTTSADVQVRSAAGAWGSAVQVDTEADQRVVSITLGFDGALLYYTIGPNPGTGSDTVRLWRSTDGGTTWTLQSYDTGLPVVNVFRLRVRRYGATGQVVAFASLLDGADFLAAHYVSTDGGYSFRMVVEDIADTTVWDVRDGGSFLHILTAEDLPTTRLVYRRLGNASASAFAVAGTTIDSGTAASHEAGAFIARHPDGTLYVGADIVGSAGWRGYRSTNSGTSWGAVGPSYGIGGTPTEAGFPSGDFVRGTLVTVANDAGAASGATPSNTVELRFGGHATATISTDVPVMLDEAFLPLDTLANHGWSTAADSGVPSRTLSADTGQRVQTAGLVTADHLNTIADSGAGAFRVVVRVASGECLALLGVNGKGVTIKITSTQLEIYDSSAGSGTPFSHGAGSAYLDILAIVDPTSAKAAVVYRALTTGAERAYGAETLLTGLGVFATSALTHHLVVSPSSDVFIGGGTGFGKATSTTHATGWTQPTGLDPVGLSNDFVPLTAGTSIRCTQGIAAVDGVTWRLPLTSLYRAENMLALTNPSPSAVWRSDGLTGDHEFALTLHEDDVSGVADNALLYGIYLDGLVGVSSLGIDDGSTSTVTLSTSAKYDILSGGKAFRPTSSGTVNQGPWVRANELLGWYFKDASGTVARITGNTEGSLTYGSTIAERRATIYLDRTIVGSNSTGTLYPARVLLTRTGWSGSDTITVTIAAASQYDPAEGYREIGLMVPGRIHVVPSPDLSDVRSVRDGANIVETPTGQRVDRQRIRPRSRVDFGWMGRMHDERGVRGASTSPDYVRSYTGGGPVGDADGGAVGLTLVGIVDRIFARGKPPVVVCPAISVAGSAGWTVYRTGDFLFSRIEGDLRVEHVDLIGVRGTSQVARASVLSFSEER